MDSLLTFTANDPGLFDSLSVSYKTDRLNFSGNYKNVDISVFPFLVVEKLQNLENYSFSAVFGDTSNQYILYKYLLSPKLKRTLSSDWLFIEKIALNKKRSTFFELWIEEQITKTYVKINKQY